MSIATLSDKSAHYNERSEIEESMQDKPVCVVDWNLKQKGLATIGHIEKVNYLLWKTQGNPLHKHISQLQRS